MELMSRAIDQPVTRAEAVEILREHLDEEEAEVLAQRIETADEDAKDAADWQGVKRHALLQKPML
jgi:hypothetical protein